MWGGEQGADMGAIPGSTDFICFHSTRMNIQLAVSIDAWRRAGEAAAAGSARYEGGYT
jgi:hypothetical protein